MDIQEIRGIGIMTKRIIHLLMSGRSRRRIWKRACTQGGDHRRNRNGNMTRISQKNLLLCHLIN